MWLLPRASCFVRQMASLRASHKPPHPPTPDPCITKTSKNIISTSPKHCASPSRLATPPCHPAVPPASPPASPSRLASPDSPPPPRQPAPYYPASPLRSATPPRHPSLATPFCFFIMVWSLTTYEICQFMEFVSLWVCRFIEKGISWKLSIDEICQFMKDGKLWCWYG